MKDVPILLIVCGKETDFLCRRKRPSWTCSHPPGSVYHVTKYFTSLSRQGIRCESNHYAPVFENELCQRLEIPEEYGIVAVIRWLPKNFGQYHESRRRS